MAKKRGTKERLVEKSEEEEATKQSSILISSSDDDEEANEDLSLQIVEKARLREANRKKRDKDSGNGVERVELVVDLSSASDREEKKKDKKSKKKKKSKKIEDEFVGFMDPEELMGTVTPVEVQPNGVVEKEKLGSEVEAFKTPKPTETEGIGTADNIVLRKLLRGARYFDPPERSCRTCYNCGEEGHNAVSCTSKKRKKPCFICGSLEHGVRNCTQGQECFICKKQGHRAKDCPNKHQMNSEDTKVCLKCGDLGHLMFSCTRDYDPDDLKEIHCYVCKRQGHLCCVDSISPGTGEVSCYNCGQSGHTGLGCAKQRGEASAAVTATLCYKCGEEGHFARGCTSYSKLGRWKGESSTPTQKYSKKINDLSRFQSAPPDFSKNRKMKNTEYEERDFETEGRTKRRGGWITDDPGDFSIKKHKDNGWRSPATPMQKFDKSPWRTGSHQSDSRSPWRSSNHNPRTPNSHGSTYPRYSQTPNSYGSSDRYGNPNYVRASDRYGNSVSDRYGNPVSDRYGNPVGSKGRRNYC